jgi:PBP1b-binding outer membrane lipoprotein LpoB
MRVKMRQLVSIIALVLLLTGCGMVPPAVIWSEYLRIQH